MDGCPSKEHAPARIFTEFMPIARSASKIFGSLTKKRTSPSINAEEEAEYHRITDWHSQKSTQKNVNQVQLDSKVLNQQKADEIAMASGLSSPRIQTLCDFEIECWLTRNHVWLIFETDQQRSYLLLDFEGHTPESDREKICQPGVTLRFITRAGPKEPNVYYSRCFRLE